MPAMRVRDELDLKPLDNLKRLSFIAMSSTFLQVPMLVCSTYRYCCWSYSVV
jgi:hypothetical protein